MNMFKWHDYAVRSMHVWACSEKCMQLLQHVSGGAVITIVIQHPDDERRVRLLKDGQPSDGGEQCETCGWCVRPSHWEQPYCPDWTDEWK